MLPLPELTVKDMARRLPSLRPPPKVAVSIALLSTACHRWAPTQVTPQELLAEGRVRRLRVTTRDDRIVLHGPEIVTDSLVGVEKVRRAPMFLNAGSYTPEPPRRRRHAVALQDVTRVERRRVDVLATAAVAAAGAGATFVGAVVVACATSGCGPGDAP